MEPQIKNQESKGPSSLVAAIGHLIGFEPEDSLVLVAISREGYRVQLLIRIDLIGSSEEKLLEDSQRALLRAHQETGADLVLPVLYVGKNWQTWREFVKNLNKVELKSLTLLDALWVDQNRYGSILCENQECCPIEGFALPSDSSLEKLQLISQGKAVMGKRESIDEYFNFVKENPKLTLSLAKLIKAKKRSKNLSWQENLYNRVFVNLMQSDQEINVLAQAEVLFATGEIPLRDRLISEVLHELQSQDHPLDKLHELKTRLLPVIQSAPSGQAKTILSCLGLWLWQLGEAVWAEAAIKQALNHDETYRLALLSLSALKSGLAPWRFADCFNPASA